MAVPKMQLEDWLDDLCARFIINLPQEDLSSVARICFQVEEAQWFYEDFIRPLDPSLPSMSLRTFCLRIFQHCPLLASFSVENHTRAFEEFLEYKTRVPVRGAILLNEAMDATVLVKGWKKGANWSFPRGKINKDEDDLDCAVREVYEETGYDLKEAGLVPEDGAVKYIEISMREQQMRLYVFRDVPMDTYFEPRTRKEISKIQWYKLSELPAFRKKGQSQTDDQAATNANKFYMVAPFLVPLKKWVVQQKKRDALHAAHHGHLDAHPAHEELLTEDDAGTQAEAYHETDSGVPAIETIEGATNELRRLLKVQPPTQGLQAPQTEQRQDRGEALLAILQRSTGPPLQQDHQNQYQQQHQYPQPQHIQHNLQQPHMPHNANPHTPQEHIYTSAPEPHTPHHHHPMQQAPLSTYGQPPPFPAATHASQNESAAFYNQFQTSQMTSAQHQLNQNMGPLISHRARASPVALLHPQPLPPQVQKTLLQRGILPTPAVPENGGMNMPPNVPYQHGPSSYGAPIQQSRQLNNHAASLLNAFKSGPQPGQQHAQSHGHQRQSSSGVQNTHPNQPPSHWPSGLPLLNHQLPAQPHVASPQELQATGSNSASASDNIRPRPTEQQRTALLDMFKKSSPAVSHSGSAAHPSSPRRARQDEQDRNYQEKPAGYHIAQAGSAPGGPVTMHPDLHLPFGAMSILSRPKEQDAHVGDQGSSWQHQPQGAAHRYSPQSQYSHKDQSSSAGPHQSFPPQAYGRGSQQAQYSPAAAHNIAETQQATAPAPPSAASIPAPGFLQRSSPANPEQRQKLLSLFAKPQPSPPVPSTAAPSIPTHTKPPNPEQRQKLLSLFGQPQPSPVGSSYSAEDKGKGREPFDHITTNVAAQQQQHHPSAPSSNAPRSRVASLASNSMAGEVPREGKSSRGGGAGGSQTPISPADRNFLLGYLDSVASKAV